MQNLQDLVHEEGHGLSRRDKVNTVMQR